MTESKYFRVMSFTLVLSGSLFGCALERTFASDSEDPAITANVEALIRQHPALGSANAIHVSAHNHVVYLSGFVDSGLETEDA